MKGKTKISMVFWPLFLIVEVAGVFVFYQTIGWLAPLVFTAVSVLACLIILVFWFRWFRIGVLLGCLYVGLVGIYGGHLGVRWYLVDSEAKRIVAWAHQKHEETGGYPDDLRGYRFLRPDCKDYIAYYPE